jgi:hypothetical protein
MGPGNEAHAKASSEAGIMVVTQEMTKQLQQQQ